MKAIMTPEQEAKCALLEIEVTKTNNNLFEVGANVCKDLYSVSRGMAVLITEGGSPEFKFGLLFASVDDAIFAAADPGKLGLRWSQ